MLLAIVWNEGIDWRDDDYFLSDLAVSLWIMIRIVQQFRAGWLACVTDLKLTKISVAKNFAL